MKLARTSHPWLARASDAFAMTVLRVVGLLNVLCECVSVALPSRSLSWRRLRRFATTTGEKSGLRWAFLIVVLSGATAVAGPRYSLDAVLENMGRVGASFRSMQADIERTKVTVIVDDKSIDSGTVYYSRRGDQSRIRLDIDEPRPQSLLIENGKALMYFPAIKQAQQYSLGDNQDKAGLLLIGFGPTSGDIEAYYEVELIGEAGAGSTATSIIELKPKSDRVAAMFTAIRLWIDQMRWIPVQTRLTEASGDYLVVTFKNIRLNGRLRDSVFDLKLPKDVRVITP